MQNIAKSKNNKKSYGIDCISNFVLKKLSPNFFRVLSILTNQIFNCGHWPQPWKKAIIVPLLKPGKSPENINNYRPISLLSCISKLCETLIYEKILNHCEEQKLLSDDQFGFRAKLSTNHALSTLMHDVSMALNNRKPTICVALDCEKAFDSVWIEALIYKMNYLYGFHEHICRLIFSYLTNRQISVKIENIYSNDRRVDTGVPQGSILAPLLFILFLTDLPNPPNTIPNNCIIRKILFADDILIYGSGWSPFTIQAKINNYLSVIANFLHRWKISLNNDKCEYLTFIGRYNSLSPKTRSNLKKIKIKIDDLAIKKVDSLKYLGIILNKNAKYHKHISNILSKSIKASHCLKRVISFNNSTSNKVKSIIYKQLIRPILCYGFCTWFDISSSQMEKIRTYERKILRAATNSYRKPNSFYFVNNKLIYKRANIERIDRFLVKNNISFMKSVRGSSNNNLRRCIAQTHDELTAYGPFFKSPFCFNRLTMD